MTYYDEKNHNVFSEKYGFNIISLGKKANTSLKFGNTKAGILLSRILTRILLQVFEYPDIKIMFDVKSGLKKIQKESFDLMISIAVPHPTHWGVAFAIKSGYKVSKVWIADCGDPYMGDKTDTFRKFFYFKYFEKSWCHLVDFITVPFEGAIKGYYKEFHDKIKIIPQGFNFDETKAMTDIYVQNSIPTFIYAGIIIPCTGP
ncbi:MAG: hypothetical protein IPN97_04570 [Saprospiraceae bacterium]|nr:hypothetical protein [Saprospiraceae bacterium]